MRSKRRTLLDSFRDAFRGAWDCVKLERNMRVHLCACCYVLFFGFRMGLGRGEMALLCLTIGAVMAMEAMNTAVERLCNFAEKRRNPHIRLIKDVAAGGVLFTALGALGVGLFLFLRVATWDALLGLLCRPLSCALLVLSAVAAVIFIALGPEGIWKAMKKKM